MAATLTTATSPNESATSSRPPDPATAVAQEAASGSRFWRVLLILLALETGCFLMLVPWSAVWGESLPLGLSVSAQSFLRNHYLRGAVSGLGLINLWVGFAEALALVRRDNSSATPRP